MLTCIGTACNTYSNEGQRNKYEKDCDTDTGFEGNSGVNSKETRTGRFYKKGK